MPRPTVPGYEVLGLLGEGASSVVWRATRLCDQRPVALKVARHPLRALDAWTSGWAAPSRDPRAVLDELDWLLELRHPGVVALLDRVVLDDDRLVLVLDLAAGGSLADLVRARGHLTADETTSVLADLASTLADLHADEVVHGDLSPGNVLLDDHGHALVSDLGTAQAVGDPLDDPWGTEGFVAPELEVDEEAGPACDVYGLGALGWLALTGHRRLPATSPAELEALAPEAPAGLRDLVLSCLAPDPADRPTAAQTRDALRSWQDDAVRRPGEGEAPAHPAGVVAGVGPQDRDVEATGTTGPAVVDVGLLPAGDDVTRRIREAALEQSRAQTRARERATKLEQVRRTSFDRPRWWRRGAALVSVGLLAAGGAQVWDHRSTDPVAARPALQEPATSTTAGPDPSSATTVAPVGSSTPAAQVDPSIPGAQAGSSPSRSPRARVTPVARTRSVAPAAPPPGQDEAVRRDAVASLQSLLDRRSAALRSRDAAALRAVAVPGSWAWQQDTRRVAELRRRGQEQQGLRFAVEQVVAVTVSGDDATVRASVRIDPWTWREGTGGARPVAGRTVPATDYRMRRTADGWRLVAAVPVAGPGSGEARGR